MGVLMVITASAFLTGAVSAVSIWLLETLPRCKISANSPGNKRAAQAKLLP